MRLTRISCRTERVSPRLLRREENRVPLPGWRGTYFKGLSKGTTMTGYDPKSCSALERPFYRPVEAALRWCGLINHEEMIIKTLKGEAIPPFGAFPQWPCLRANTEKILDAIANREIPHGRDGKNVGDNDHVAPARLTVRHTDLRAWMDRYYPDQKPAFLFDEVERNTHRAINADSFRALQADRDALAASVEKARLWGNEIREELNKVKAERDELLAQSASGREPNARAESTYQTIIAALVSLMLDKTPAGKKHSVFDSQAAIIEALVTHNPGAPGLSVRNLEAKFAEARRALEAV